MQLRARGIRSLATAGLENCQVAFCASVVLFTTAVVAGIVDNEDALWKSSLGVCCLLILLAVVSSVFAYRFGGARGEQSQGGGQHGTPEDAVAAFA